MSFGYKSSIVPSYVDAEVRAFVPTTPLTKRLFTKKTVDLIHDGIINWFLIVCKIKLGKQNKNEIFQQMKTSYFILIEFLENEDIDLNARHTFAINIMTYDFIRQIQGTIIDIEKNKKQAVRKPDRLRQGYMNYKMAYENPSMSYRTSRSDMAKKSNMVKKKRKKMVYRMDKDIVYTDGYM